MCSETDRNHIKAYEVLIIFFLSYLFFDILKCFNCQIDVLKAKVLQEGKFYSPYLLFILFYMNDKVNIVYLVGDVYSYSYNIQRV